jgi:hypothetical protein
MGLPHQAADAAGRGWPALLRRPSATAARRAAQRRVMPVATLSSGTSADDSSLLPRRRHGLGVRPQQAPRPTRQDPQRASRPAQRGNRFAQAARWCVNLRRLE